MIDTLYVCHTMFIFSSSHVDIHYLNAIIFTIQNIKQRTRT